MTYNATVAQDGSANYTCINDAIAGVPVNSKNRDSIHVLPGVYKENVQVNKTDIALIDDYTGTTIITGNKSNASGHQTYDTTRMFVAGYGFIAESLTIENSVPLTNSHQAVALNILQMCLLGLPRYAIPKL
ncbi:hypothetical protein Acr_08g0019220 [Actinidia rufa]|uniref:Pectinesterase catalytic domain-containing protein n=1 Tax=Actinidia rufa TaxID=165716 RepID=A0A7J0F564_9ERIC|nr:hypothetical protein Acr_08g0019220 [Actinidia rufa]